MSATQTATLTDLPVHPEQGWPVDPGTGVAYGARGRWVGKPLGRIGSHGYLVVTLRGRAFLLHRVVWEACVGPIPAGLVINHKNGVKTDNRLANLEVVTRAQNNQHAYDTGLHSRSYPSGPRNHNYRVTPEMKVDILARIARGESSASVARVHGVSYQTVFRVKSGQR